MVLFVGIKVFEFMVKDINGKIVFLFDFIGKIVVMYFYFKDDIFGCIKEV